MANERLQKANTFLNRIKLHKHQCHSISILAAKRLWVTYGHPLLEYGIALWATTSDIQASFNTAQNAVLKELLGLPSSYSTELLLAAFDISNMHERITSAQFAMTKRAYKYKQSRPHHDALNHIQQITTNRTSGRSYLLKEMWSPKFINHELQAKWFANIPNIEDFSPNSSQLFTVLNVTVQLTSSPGEHTTFLHNDVVQQTSIKTVSTALSAYSSSFVFRLKQRSIKYMPSQCPFCKQQLSGALQKHCLLYCASVCNMHNRVHQDLLKADANSALIWQKTCYSQQRKLLCKAPLNVDLCGLMPTDSS
jgi:hypothetical protein